MSGMRFVPCPPFVIPAKAGIHRSATASLEAWTPAFAGVTVRACGADDAFLGTA
jgi:hypothetical protein